MSEQGTGGRIEQDAPTPETAPWRRSIVTGGCYYAMTMLVVMLGVSWGADYLERQESPYETAPGSFASMGNRDGVAYAMIAREGYTYDREHHSSVAYFPVYPLLGRGLSRLSGMTHEAALLCISHACLIGAFVLLANYVRVRCPEAPSELSDWTLLAFGLWPTTMFFRMTYTESLFVLVILSAMYAMQRRWPVGVVGVLVGLATACRPVGVALLAPFAFHLWQTRKSTPNFVLRGILLTPLALWGLLAYMAYQHQIFGDAFAFMKAQDDFAGQMFSQREQVLSALTLEPLWSKYDPSSPSYWLRGDDVRNPLFSLEFANPIYFLATMALVGVGAWKGWLDEREWFLAVGLLLIPYLTHAHRTGMLSQGRYAASVFPFYLVLGRFLWRLPPPLSAALCACSAFLLGVYAALFAASYRII